MRIINRLVLELLLLLAAAAPATALDPGKAITQYGHRVWQDQDGLPQNSVFSITQTLDGYLWLGTGAGVARFDGVRFVVFDRKNTPVLSHDHVTALAASRDGTLWVGTRGGGLSRFQDGVARAYGASDGFAHTSVLAIVEDSEGNLWIGTGSGLVRYRGGRFTRYTTRNGLVGSSVRAIRPAKGGGLWVGHSGGVSWFKDGRFFNYGASQGLSCTSVRAIWEDREGSLWVGTESGGLHRLRQGRFIRYTARDGIPSQVIRALYQDRQGNVWIGTGDAGLLRFCEGRFTKFRIREGLSGNTVRSIFEDREGNLWVGTEGGGLNRFQDGKVTTLTTKEGLSSDFIRAIRQDRLGAMWIGTEGGGLNHVHARQFRSYTSRNGLATNFVTSLCEDRDGSLWVGIEDGGLHHLKNGRVTIYNVRDGLSNDTIWAIHQDRHGALWLGTGTHLNRLQGGRFTAYPSQNSVRAIHEDRAGNLWLGFQNGHLTRYYQGQFLAFTPKDGMPRCNVSGFHEDNDGVLWIATDRGLVRFRDGVFRTYTAADGLFSDHLFQVLEDGRERLWMSSIHGVFQVSKRELEELAEGRARAIRSVAYTTADGMKSSECTGDAQPAGWKSRDGKLWFPTVRGVVIIDPEQNDLNPVPPPVRIEELAANERQIPLVRNAELAPETEELSFRYTGLSFLAPQNVRFRYRLEGLEKDWTEAGTRREARYTSLPPGRYKFRVIACNNDGVWNEEGASYEFSIRPHFYQTAWFYGLCVALLVSFTAGMHRFRLRQMRREFSAVLAERNRMAREIHDTLLQGFAGTALQIEAISQKLMAAPAAAKVQLDRVLNQVDHCLVEARRSIWNLRSQTLETEDLPGALARVAQQLTAGTPVRSEVKVVGVPRRLSDAVENNLLRIAQEAVANAVRYSQAERICIELCFGSQTVRLRAKDDGRGFADSLSETSPEGHFGLTGMRERAEQIDGRLTLCSSPNQGTEILVAVPIK